jgi:hypothetical protein
MNLLIKDIDINQAKKIAILLGRDFKEIEEKEKKKGKVIKTDAELLAEMKADTDKKVNDKKSKKK